MTSPFSQGNQRFNPEIYDLDTYHSGPWPSPGEGLATWKTMILQIWSSNIGRKASTNDLVFLRCLLDVKEDTINASLELIDFCKSHFTEAGEGCGLTDAAHSLRAGSQIMSDMNPIALTGGASFVKAPEGTFGPLESQAEVASSSGHENLGNLVAGGIGQRIDHESSTPISRLSNIAAGKQPILDHVDSAFDEFGLHFPCSASSARDTKFGQTMRQLIKQVMSEKATKGCKTKRGHGSKHGKYLCTLGCGGRFLRPAEATRHEEIVYPQSFFFCLTCGDLPRPTKKHLFTRPDKMRDHIKLHKHSITVDQCKVSNIQGLCPEKCGLCSHHKHRNWKERCKHITWHYKRDDFVANIHGTSPDNDHGVGNSNGGDDGDSDDDNADDDDQEDDNEDDPTQRDHHDNGRSSGGNDPGASGSKPYDGGGYFDTSGENAEDISGWLIDSPGFWSSFSMVRMMTLLTSSTFEQCALVGSMSSMENRAPSDRYASDQSQPIRNAREIVKAMKLQASCDQIRLNTDSTSSSARTTIPLDELVRNEVTGIHADAPRYVSQCIEQVDLPTTEDDTEFPCTSWAMPMAPSHSVHSSAHTTKADCASGVVDDSSSLSDGDFYCASCCSTLPLEYLVTNNSYCHAEANLPSHSNDALYLAPYSNLQFEDFFTNNSSGHAGANGTFERTTTESSAKSFRRRADELRHEDEQTQAFGSIYLGCPMVLGSDNSVGTNALRKHIGMKHEEESRRKDEEPWNTRFPSLPAIGTAWSGNRHHTRELYVTSVCGHDRREMGVCSHLLLQERSVYFTDSRELRNASYNIWARKDICARAFDGMSTSALPQHHQGDVPLSPWLIRSSPVVLHCEHDRCTQSFTGTYRHGTRFYRPRCHNTRNRVSKTHQSCRHLAVLVCTRCRHIRVYYFNFRELPPK
jgi:hypothetical protein